MANELKDDEEAIFNAAVQLTSGTERDEYLAKACGRDNELRAGVEALLQAHEAQSLLDVPMFDSEVTLDKSPLTEGPGTVIGRYKLLEKIGEGGMAVVYMAEQQKPIRRKVALKIIKLGMDTKQVIARFEVERQALAMMDHPNIAKVLDAGATETGRPYFVMELVTGVSITEYCDKNELNMRERLALFIQVCNAVQHAHQKGIIHRDIKPSNVMVTHRDGTPVPKIIDFGIAKAINQRLTEKTLFTRYAHIIGTPAYMSPEQSELSDLDIDTRSDIYSLGVLLYELLTGTPPFSEDQLHKAGYLEMQRIIREEEPTKPSTKLSTLGETLTEIAKHRSSTPDLLRKAIRGDLDWIVMKALEKARDRRYDTVNALVMDVQRHLKDEPIRARAPSTAYRLQKFLRRHQMATVAGMAISICALVVLSLLVKWKHAQRRLDAEVLLRHRITLAVARRAFAKGEADAALAGVESILPSKYVEAEAQVLYDQILDRVQESVSEFSRRIEARPKDAENYLYRAGYYHYLHNDSGVIADMKRYVAILNPSYAANSQNPLLQDFLIGLWQSTPSNLGPTINSPSNDALGSISADGLSIFFDSDRPGGQGYFDIWVATRPTVSAPWGPPVNLRPPINTELWDGAPSLSPDGLSLFFNSDRAAGHGASDIWVSTRETIRDPWGTPVNLRPPINSADWEWTGSISPDGLTLYFGSDRSGGQGGLDIWVTTRAATDNDWSVPVNLGSTVNSPYHEIGPIISADGLTLFLTSERPGGYGGRDIWVTTRKTREAEWGTPVNLGLPINSSAYDQKPIISADGSTLYFNSMRPGGYGGLDVWQVPILPVPADSQQNGHSDSAGKSITHKDRKEVMH